MVRELKPKKSKAYILRQLLKVSYQRAIQEIHSALKTGYEISYVYNNPETVNKISLLKYDVKKECLLALNCVGNAEEMAAALEDPVIKNYI